VVFFPPDPWSEAHYAGLAPRALGSQSVQAQPVTSHSTESANRKEMTPPSYPRNEKKKEEQAGDKTVAEQTSKEKEENKKEEAGSEKKDEKNWSLIVG
jgi:hypothetical protein